MPYGRRRAAWQGIVAEPTAIALLALTAWAAACSAPPTMDQPAAAGGVPAPSGETGRRDHLVDQTTLAMGSSLHLSAWTPDESGARAAFQAVFAEFDRLDALLSVWREGSDVLKINAAAGVAPVEVHPDTLDVVFLARQISEWTGGKFDITFGALADVWKFDHDQDNVVPTREQVATRLPLVDYTQIELNPSARTVFVKRKGMRIHLGGIGKGFAVERAVGILRHHGLRNFMVQAGGDLYVGGRRGDRPWRLGVNDPRGPAGQSFATIELTDATFSTSGDYERYFVANGTRYHHILDPDTGEPARGCRSVTIVSKSPVQADGLSTGVFILGPEAGLALVEKLPDVEAVIVTASNQVLVSSGLKDKVTIVAPPTDAP